MEKSGPRRVGLRLSMIPTEIRDGGSSLGNGAVVAEEKGAAKDQLGIGIVVLRRLVFLGVVTMLWLVLFPSTFEFAPEGKRLPFGDGVFQSNDALGLLAYLLFMKPLLRLAHNLSVTLRLTKFEYEKSLIAEVEPAMSWLGLLFVCLALFDALYTYGCGAASDLHICTWVPSRVTSISMALYTAIAINFIKRLFVRKINIRSLNRNRRAESVLLEKGITAVSLLLLVLFTAVQLGVSTSTILTYGGFSTLALGFAAQHIMKDVYGGFMLYLFKPFMEGDDIRLPDYDQGGLMRVMEIGWLQTEVRLWDSSQVIVPNSQIFGHIVVNRSLKRYAYITEVVHVRYADLPRLDDLLDAMRMYLTSRPEVAADESPPIVTVEKLDAHYVDIRLMIWLRNVPTRTRLHIASSLFIGLAHVIQDRGCDFAYPRLRILTETETEKIFTEKE